MEVIPAIIGADFKEVSEKIEKVKKYINDPDNYGLLVTIVPIIFFILCAILIYIGFIILTKS